LLANCGQTAAVSDTVTIDSYRNLPTPYPTVPSPTLYDVPFSHNTKRYRQTDDRRTEHRAISAAARPYYQVRSAKNQSPLTSICRGYVVQHCITSYNEQCSVIRNELKSTGSSQHVIYRCKLHKLESLQEIHNVLASWHVKILQSLFYLSIYLYSSNKRQFKCN